MFVLECQPKCFPCWGFWCLPPPVPSWAAQIMKMSGTQCHHCASDFLMLCAFFFFSCMQMRGCVAFQQIVICIWQRMQRKQMSRGANMCNFRIFSCSKVALSFHSWKRSNDPKQNPFLTATLFYYLILAGRWALFFLSWQRSCSYHIGWWCPGTRQSPDPLFPTTHCAAAAALLLPSVTWLLAFSWPLLWDRWPPEFICSVSARRERLGLQSSWQEDA